MKSPLIGLVIILYSFTNTSVGHIDFHYGDMKTVIERAQSEDKLIFVDVYASWCTSCKLMEESTFRSEDVTNLMNDHYVPVKLNIESLEGEIFAVQEGITVLPALFVLNKKGNKLTQVNQALQAKGMVKLLKKHLD